MPEKKKGRQKAAFFEERESGHLVGEVEGKVLSFVLRKL
jgi:hypothetical protein